MDSLVEDRPRARARTSDTDVAIIGCGLAGLSLATALVRAGYSRRITLIDTRDDFTNDRTWCWWHVEGLPFSEYVVRRWNTIVVRTPTREARRSSSRHPYNYLPADRFYDAALGALDGRCTLQLGTRCHGVRHERGAHVLTTTQGELSATLVFDARGTRSAAAGKPLLYQSFSGWNVSADEGAFDPDVVTLMDFSGTRSPDVTFTYILPFTAGTALIEHTALGATPTTHAEHDQALRTYVHEQLPWCTTTIYRREHGVLAMGGTTPKVEHGVIPIGIAGGAVRSSSGFTFVRTQRWSQRLAHAIVAGELPAGLPDAARYERYDRVFLALLRRRPDLAPALICKWFARAPKDVLERFMSDATTLADDAGVLFGAALALYPG